MTEITKDTIVLAEESPAEMILSMASKEVLRLSYCRNVQSGRMQWIELYIWICPKSGFFQGLYDISGKNLRIMSEEPLNSLQLLKHVNSTHFQPGVDLIEKVPNMSIGELQRLTHFSLKAA